MGLKLPDRRGSVVAVVLQMDPRGVEASKEELQTAFNNLLQMDPRGVEAGPSRRPSPSGRPLQMDPRGVEAADSKRAGML